MIIALLAIEAQEEKKRRRCGKFGGERPSFAGSLESMAIPRARADAFERVSKIR
jgi:hypothetical protein